MSSDPKLPKRVGHLMVGIIVGFALVALYANIQKLRRSALETVIFTPASSQTTTPSPTATP